jgi:hypothetical protein
MWFAAGLLPDCIDRRTVVMPIWHNHLIRVYP